MKNSSARFLSLLCFTCLVSLACKKTKQEKLCDENNAKTEALLAEESQRAAEEEAHQLDMMPLPAQQMPSVDDIIYSVTVFDTLTDGTVKYSDHVMWDGSVKEKSSLYDGEDGYFTFRGGTKRDADFCGSVKGNPTRIVKVWSFDTFYDNTQTSLGSWGGGSGWTGEPVYVKWPKERMEQFRATSKALTTDFSDEEIIVGSLCGRVYFLNWQNGKESRRYLDVTNPIKGSVSLDPTLNGNLYVGQGVPKVAPMGQMAWDLNTHKNIFFSGRDKNSWVKWGAYDSSPVRVGKFLFWPGENGTFYKYLILDNNEGLKLHSTLRFKPKNGSAAGMENSVCIYKNYGWFGTNNGHIVCVDLNTMTPVWHYNNSDDIDASIVCELTDGIPYLYCGCEVDHQGNYGKSHFVKLNGLTGELVWKNDIACRKLNIGSKHFDGGFYSTPLLGRGDCDSLIYANVCQRGESSKAEFTAFSRTTGEVVYRTQLKNFAWSSPVGFLNEDGKYFIFAGDASGNAYLLDGATGNIIYEESMCNNFESSPVVVGNELVVGSRGTKIIKYRIE